MAIDVLDEVVPDFLLTGGEHSRSSVEGSVGVTNWVERVFVTSVEIPADGVNERPTRIVLVIS
jgi:hypothetical protein